MNIVFIKCKNIMKVKEKFIKCKNIIKFQEKKKDENIMKFREKKKDNNIMKFREEKRYKNSFKRWRKSLIKNSKIFFKSEQKRIIQRKKNLEKDIQEIKNIQLINFMGKSNIFIEEQHRHFQILLLLGFIKKSYKVLKKHIIMSFINIIRKNFKKNFKIFFKFKKYLMYAWYIPQYFRNLKNKRESEIQRKLLHSEVLRFIFLDLIKFYYYYFPQWKKNFYLKSKLTRINFSLKNLLKKKIKKIKLKLKNGFNKKRKKKLLRLKRKNLLSSFSKQNVSLKILPSQRFLKSKLKFYKVQRVGFSQILFLQLWDYFCKWSIIKNLTLEAHWMLLDTLQFYSGWTKDRCFWYWTNVKKLPLQMAWTFWNYYNGFNRFDWWNATHMPYKFLIMCFHEKFMPKLTIEMKKGLYILFRNSYKYRDLLYAFPLLQFKALKFLIKPYLFWWLYFIYLWFIFYIKTLFSLWLRCLLISTQVLLYKVKYNITSKFLWFLIIEEGNNSQFTKKQMFYFKFFFGIGYNRIMRWRYSTFLPYLSSCSFIKRAMWHRRFSTFYCFVNTLKFHVRKTLGGLFYVMKKKSLFWLIS